MEPTFVSARINMSRLRHRELIEFAWFGCWTTSYLKRMEQGSNMRCKTFLDPPASMLLCTRWVQREPQRQTNNILHLRKQQTFMHFALRTAASDKAAAAYAVVQVGCK